MRQQTHRILLTGGAVLAVSGAVFGVALHGAFTRVADARPDEMSAPAARVAPVTDTSPLEGVLASSAPQEAAAPSSRSAPREPALSPEVLDLAVREAPFEESRRAPAGRYRLPGEEVRGEPEPVELPPPPEFQLLGSVSGPDGGFIVLRVDGEEPRMVSAGESVEGYRLATVEVDRAVMEGPGGTVDVPLASASPTVEDNDDDDDDRRRFRRRSRDDDEEPSRTESNSGGAPRVDLNDDGTITIVRPGAAAGVSPGPIFGPSIRLRGSP